MTLDEIRAVIGKFAAREVTRDNYLELKAFAMTSDFKDNNKQITVWSEWRTITQKYEGILRGDAVAEYEKLVSGERSRRRISSEDVLGHLLNILVMAFADSVTDGHVVDLLNLLNRRSHGKFAFDASPAFQKLTLLRPFAAGMFLGRKDDPR